MATTTEVQLAKSAGTAFGVVWGTECALTGAGVIVGTPSVSSANTTKGAKYMEEFNDPATGDLKLLVVSGKFREMSIEVTPSHTTKALAITANIVPEPGDLVSLVDLKSGDLLTAQQFVVKSASGSMATGKIATISMTIARYKTGTAYADMAVIS